MMNQTTKNQLQDIVENVAKVRKWLTMLTCLRWLAILFVFVMAYIALYAALDHRLHFSSVPRVLALSILGGIFIYGLYRFFKELKSHASLNQAALFVESSQSYRQQLVSTIEYHQNIDDYPYSHDLAHFMINKVHAQIQQRDLSKTVAKTRAKFYGAVVAIGLLATGWMMVTNGTYFGRYIARLVQPTAVIAPVPATDLILVSGDVVAAPMSNFEVAAAISGKVPESGKLVIVSKTEDSESVFKSIPLSPQQSSEDIPEFSLVAVLPPGDYQYRFEAGDAVSESKEIHIAPIPEITSVEAKIRPPKELGMDPYSQVIEDQELSVQQYAEIDLILTLSEPIKSGEITGLDENPVEFNAEGDHQLTLTFKADKARELAMAVTSVVGLSNDSAGQLILSIKQDKAPVFKYESPGSDYVATQVSSIPLEMKVSDEFGLTEATLIYEIEGQAPVKIIAPINGTPKELSVKHTLELEDLDLDVNDVILVYAEARDLASAMKPKGELAKSAIQFIEIKPYNRVFHQLEAPMPSGLGPQGMTPGEKLPTLMALLEYSRAVMKKTWKLQTGGELSQQGKKDAEAIAGDSTYIREKINKILEVYSSKLTREQYDGLSQVRDAYRDIASNLNAHKVEPALEPAKIAYRRMRELAKEMQALMGTGSPDPGLEKLKIEEQVHLTRFEDEEVQWELDKLSEQLASVQVKQKALENRFRKMLAKQEKQEGHKQSITDSESSTQTDPYKDDRGPKKESTPGQGGESRKSRE